VGIAEKVFKVRGQRSRSHVYRCYNGEEMHFKRCYVEALLF